MNEASIAAFERLANTRLADLLSQRHTQVVGAGDQRNFGVDGTVSQAGTMLWGSLLWSTNWGFVMNNITDYDSNYQFARHVLMMDSTFAGNHVMWRAVNSPAVHTAFYLSIIAWESVTMLLCWWGALQLARSAQHLV